METNFSDYKCNGKGCQFKKKTCKRYRDWVKAFQEDKEVKEFETAPFGYEFFKNDKKQICNYWVK